MFNRFFKDSLVYWGGIILSQGIGLILLPFYAHIFSPAHYGVIDLLTIATKLVNLTVALEISQGVARFYPEAKTGNDKIGYASTALWFTMLMYSLFVFGALWFAVPLSRFILESNEFQTVFQVALLAMWAEGIFILVQNQLRFRLQPTAYAMASIVNVAVSVTAIITLLLGFGLGVVAVFYGQFAGMLAGSAIAFYYARQDYRLTFNLNMCKTMLHFSIPLVPSSIAVFVVLYVDRIMIRTLMSIDALGIYAVGYRVASIVMLLMAGFQTALTPLIYTYYREATTPQELARIFRYFIAFALGLFGGLSIFAPEIVAILTAPDYYGAAGLIPILIPAILLYRMYIFAPGLSIAKQTGIIAVINLLGAVINVGLNLALISQFGLPGAALATLLSAAVSFGIHVVFSQKHYFVPHTWRNLGLATLFVVLIAWTGIQINLDLWTGLIFKSALFCLIIAAIVLLKVIKVEELARMWFWVYHRPAANKV